MKMKRFTLFTVLWIMFSLASVVQAQSCDTCTTAWGPETQVTYENVVHPNLPACTLHVVVSYKTRICNGKVQFMITDLYLVDASASPCVMHCAHAGIMYEMAIKQIVLDMGVPVYNYRPAACYAAVEVDPPASLKSCFGAEWGMVHQWMYVFPCDAAGCCLSWMTPDPISGQVREETILTVDCPPSAAPNISSPVEIRCYKNGVWLSEWVNVIPGQAPTCEPVCHSTGTDRWFKAPQAVRHTPELQLSPNPVENRLHIAFEVEDSPVQRLILVNTSGQIVLDLQQDAFRGEFDIDVSDLPAGAYICNIFTETAIFTSNSVVIKH